MTENKYFSISVITATYNSKKHIPILIESLRSQSNKNFEWVISDGGSSDGTVELLNTIDDLNIVITQENDFGIYDALNRGIKVSSGSYYIVIGSDDIFYNNAIEDFLTAISLYDAAIITAGVKCRNKIWRTRRHGSWINKQFAYISAHAVGTAFKKNLHEKYGYYSPQFPIAADQHFVLNVCKSKEPVKEITSVVGKFSTGGISSTDIIGTLSESFRVQVLFHNKYVQLAIFLLKLVKNFYKVK